MAMSIKTSPELWGEDAKSSPRKRSAMANYPRQNFRNHNERCFPPCWIVPRILYFLPVNDEYGRN